MSEKITLLNIKADTYTSPDFKAGVISRLIPTIVFYCKAIAIVIRASIKAKVGKYTLEDWARSSQEVFDMTEHVGGKVTIEGLDNLRNIEGPCVIVANHMSTLETFMLPGMISPIKNLSFVIKHSLTEYPVFKHVIRASLPITVTRTNPRDDLKSVFEKGGAMLKEGRSVLIFPQTTRSNTFDPEKFNTIGVKLAARSSVPVIPLALVTNMWANGKTFKDYGKIYPHRPVRYCFGKPIKIEGKGSKEHAEIVNFIQGKVDSWLKTDNNEQA